MNVLTDTQKLAARMLRSDLVSNIGEYKDDLIFELGSKGAQYKANAITVVDGIVFLIYLKVEAAPKSVPLNEFISEINTHIPFGNFCIVGEQIVFKIYLITLREDNDDADLIFALYWSSSIISDYIDGFRVVIDGLVEPTALANKLLDKSNEKRRNRSLSAKQNSS